MARYRRRLRKQREREREYPNFRADLHMHTVRSDGRYSSQQVLEAAAQGGLDVISITDHDIAPVLSAGLHEVNGKVIHVIHGVELSGHHNEKEFHLLAYFPGEIPLAFREFCRDLCKDRAHRYNQAVHNLGLELPLADELAQQGERALTRTHLARLLLEKGYVSSYDQAFQEYLRKDGVVPLIKLSFLDAIAEAKSCGAFLSWAHPSLEMAKQHARLFAEQGLNALEVIRPKQSKTHRKGLRKIAENLQLFISGGSDSHGFGPPLGTFAFSGWDMLWTRQVGVDPNVFQ